MEPWHTLTLSQGEKIEEDVSKTDTSSVVDALNLSGLGCVDGRLGVGLLELEALHDDDGDDKGDEVAGWQRGPNAVQAPYR